MDPKFFSSISSQVYVSLWSKYRPAILQLMIASEEGPQEYKLYGHEFKSLNPKEKKGYTFTLQAYQGRAINNIKDSVTAQDLLYVLSLSKKANELMDAGRYEFTLSKQFTLCVTKLAAA
ncbi:hypothetical protein [Ohtaekwangia koreensis]|jgi:hypothetical protein|uniref:Uncharacterized protein n=1 Tax=Ohtaekwangia koreensis TaxID=688867 RepID=A0A1T5L921_9BACT|nr:hypothetical protein [Ohtaekwangia koreensis]SKC72440.1 hypothetical protein SAMN05660236_2773 [Ohtaekwangia koreensis]